MKKIFSHLFILFLVTSLSYSQKNTNQITPNPDYEKYLELKKTGLWKNYSPDGFPLGYTPAPFTIPHNPTSAILPAYKSGEETLPASFDLRDIHMVTSAKDQGGGATGGNCTSFATMGSLESRWLEIGLDSFDLSEQNLATCHGYEWVYGEGANQYICTAYLSRFSGPVLESQHLYDLDSFPCVELDPIALIPEARWLPGRDFQLLKEIIYNYGAVWVSVHYDPSSFNGTDNTYYYQGILPGNHAFLVCGWNDTKATAGGTGAWIVKNSWGTGWAENGFVNVSYADSRFGDEMAYFPVRWDTSKVDSLYMYDWLGAVQVMRAFDYNEIWELAKFIAPKEELLTRIGITVADPKTIIDIEIYDDFDGSELSNLLTSRSGDIADVPGLYTFEVPVSVNGDFYVKVKKSLDKVSLENPVDIFFPIETFDDGYADPLIETDVNWISTDGENWASTNPGTTHQGIFYSTGFNLTVRAYTSFDTGPKALFKANKTTTCDTSRVIFTFLENNPVTNYSWDFGQGASPATASTRGPHTVSYSTEGTKTISLIVDGPGGKDTLVRHDYVYVTDAIELIVPRSVIRIIPGDSAEISAYGADEYIWVPSTILSANTGQTVMAKPQADDTYNITVFGIQGGCNAQATVEIVSAIPPENDDICGAILIEPVGLVGTFSNENGTKQSGEPAPDPINCYSDSTWCANEPGVKNSIWFYFYGPESGIASFRSGGSDNWDNQIAIYRADTCISVVKDSLVGANDDQTAAILPAQLDVTVTPGARYFLQMDGSGESQMGTCDLYFYDSYVGLEKVTGPGNNDGVSIYPNPATGIFNIRMSEVRSGQIDVLVYNMNGQLVREKSFKGLSGEFNTQLDLKEYTEGVYHIRLIDGDRVIHSKIIKE